MLNAELLEEYAYKVLEVAIEGKNLDFYIGGVGPYRILTKDALGNDVESITIKMEAIYKYARANPTFGELVYDTLKKATVIVKASRPLINILSSIEYQIVAEGENRAAFKMNNAELLENLRQNLAINKELYSTEPYVKNNFMDTIQQHDEMLSRYYGYKIL